MQHHCSCCDDVRGTGGIKNITRPHSIFNLLRSGTTTTVPRIVYVLLARVYYQYISSKAVFCKYRSSSRAVLE